MALSVPLSRFTSRVGGGSAFFVRQHEHTSTNHRDSVGNRSVVFFWLGIPQFHAERNPNDEFGQPHRSSCEVDWHCLRGIGIVVSFTLCNYCADVSSYPRDEMTMTMLPNQSPEPTADAALGLRLSVSARHALNRLRLSFFR